MIDNCAPYSAIGQGELLELNYFVGEDSYQDSLEQFPDAFKDHPYCKCDRGGHANDIRPILGSVVINVTNNNTILQVHHLVLALSCQWVFRRNITSRSSIVQLDNSGMVIIGFCNQLLHLIIV